MLFIFRKEKIVETSHKASKEEKQRIPFCTFRMSTERDTKRTK